MSPFVLGATAFVLLLLLAAVLGYLIPHYALA